jgi:hypothetical protein
MGQLNGLCLLPEGWGIDWSLFFEGLPTPLPKGELPGHAPPGVPKNSLALRNLIHGLALGLPNGQSIAQALGEKPVCDDIL